LERLRERFRELDRLIELEKIKEQEGLQIVAKNEIETIVNKIDVG
jgi:hypothetical protein